jgi:hypothetical protein
MKMVQRALIDHNDDVIPHKIANFHCSGLKMGHAAISVDISSPIM